MEAESPENPENINEQPVLDPDFSLDFSPVYKLFSQNTPYKRIGKIVASRGAIFEASLNRAQIGASVEFVTEYGETSLGEVVGIKNNRCLVMPYNEIGGINSETKVILKDLVTQIRLSKSMLGRVLDFQGRPIDDKGPLEGPFETRSIMGTELNPLDRPQVRSTLDVGINAINCFTTLGKGQRLAIMAGSGVGKSVLLGMVARNTEADVNVIALVGERGREVLEFIQSDLGEEGLKKSVILVATSDKSPLIKIKAAYAATTVAEYFRDDGNDVLLMMDSITRFAMAYREISLGAGEPPGQKGYTPSVFSKIAKLMERAGTKRDSGSITGIYSVLVEGGDMDEPVADAVRGISDGHVILSRDLAAKNHYPAIDVLSSISRVMTKVVSKEHRIVSGHLKDLFAAYKESEDLINVGAYVKGTNAKVDKAVSVYDQMLDLLKQDIEESYTIEELYDRMVEIARLAENSIEVAQE